MIIRNKSPRYTVIPNQLLEDERVSWEAKGLMCSLLAKQEVCQINISALASEDKLDEETIRGLLEDLVRAGYLEDDREESR
ncbi:MAG: hypothetical protein ACU4EQ_03980 [Candidatus Nitrosoglobus sp.]|jgi:hypothetical protein